MTCVNGSGAAGRDASAGQVAGQQAAGRQVAAETLAGSSALREALNDPGTERALLSLTAALTSWSSPYPPPELLRGYEEVVKGSANRIISMAENQQEHRHFLEETTITGANRRAWWGLWLGFVISLVVLGLGTLVILEGHSWAGASLMGVDVVALAGIFVYGRREQRKERGRRDDQAQPPPALPGPRLSHSSLRRPRRPPLAQPGRHPARLALGHWRSSHSTLSPPAKQRGWDSADVVSAVRSHPRCLQRALGRSQRACQGPGRAGPADQVTEPAAAPVARCPQRASSPSRSSGAIISPPRSSRSQSSAGTRHITSNSIPLGSLAYRDFDTR